MVRREPFEDPRVRNDASCLGVWLFLAGDAVLFAGPFCAYAVMRSGRPEVFEYGQYYMSAGVGALATGALLASCLFAALAARAAALRNSARASAGLAVTLLLGLVFLGIVASDVRHHAAKGHLPGGRFHPAIQVWETPRFARVHPESARYATELAGGVVPDHSTVTANPLPPREYRAHLPPPEGPLVRAGVLGERSLLVTVPSMPPNAHTFFGLYFLLLGLHSLHVLAGVGVWSWQLFGTLALRRPASAGALVRTGLYWQFLGIIWLFTYALYFLA
jgi:cytochrome c oxidase subunit 3